MSKQKFRKIRTPNLRFFQIKNSSTLDQFLKVAKLSCSLIITGSTKKQMLKK